MFVLIVGGGKTGSHLASLLIAEGYHVKVIEQRRDVLERLRDSFSPGEIVAGDGTNPTLLEKAGIKEADVLAAVTGEDEANLVITTLGRFEFKVPRTVARINNPKNAWLFTDDMGVDVALNQAEIIAKLILEEMSLGDMMTLLKLRQGEYSLIEEKVHPTSVAAQCSVRTLNLPPDCTLVAVIRKGKLIIPHGDTVLLPADEVLAIVHQSQLSELAAVLGSEGPK